MKADEIPKGAVEIIKETYDDGAKKFAEYYLDGEKVAFRYWYEDGQLEFESFFKDGKQHGSEKRWHPNGQLMWQSFYVDGKEHGTAMQWDDTGKLLGSYTLNYGTGVDRWWNDDGWISEEHHLKDGKPHGYERWWAKNNQLSSERFWKEGELHGIERSWSYRGRLERGYPKYFVNGIQVTRRQYFKALANDPTLIPINEADNLPVRNAGQ